MIWEHPTIGRFSSMPEGLQPGKVWRHLHSPNEQWSELVGTDTAGLRAAARAQGCPPWRGSGDYPWFSPACVPILREHHDRFWAEAYGRLLLDPSARCGRSKVDNRWVVLAPRGVYGVIAPGRPSSVLTIYRPHLRGLNVRLTEEHFAYEAAARWRKETEMPTSAARSELAQRVPDTAGLWRLAKAIGETESSTEPEVVAARREAETWLRAMPPALLASAVPERAALLDDLEEALRDEDADVVGALLGIEDAVVVTSVLAGASARDELVSALGDLLDWAPASWSRLAALPALRQASGAVSALSFWARAADAVEAATLQALPVVHRPAATLAAILVAPPWWQRWARELAAVGEGLAASLTPSQGGWALAVGRMSGDGGAWDVVPPGDLTAGERVFVVDAEHTDGMDVTADLVAGQPIWELERPGDEIRVIVVRGATPGTLAEALAAAASGAPVHLDVIELSRPR